MASVPKVLILGHSFVRRLKNDLHNKFDPRATTSFGLVGTAEVHLHGIGGRTVQKLTSCDLEMVRLLAPDVVLLEIGTNDLTSLAPEVVGSSIEELVLTLKGFNSVAVVGVCHVIPRGEATLNSMTFWERATVLQQYLEVVLDPLDSIFCWRHKVFTRPNQDFYLRDGVHLNVRGQYLLYRSYRGAILKALSYLI